MANSIGVPLLIANGSKRLLSRCSTESSVQGAYCEEYLQELIDEHPEVLPISEFIEEAKGVYSLGREVEVGGGYIDNVLVTDDGHLVIVETKLVRNSEAVRKVVAQILSYGMAVSELSAAALEDKLRRCSSKSRKLLDDQTVSQYLRNLPGDQPVGIDEDFDESFDQLRREGEILLLIVGDQITKSAEKLVGWMAKAGSTPYKLGAVELCLYDLPGGERIVMPKTLLRTREASRHVVTIAMRGSAREQVTATVGIPDQTLETRRIAPAGQPMTLDIFRKQVREKGNESFSVIVEDLISGLNSKGFDTRGTPSTFQYGVTAKGDFIPLINLGTTSIWFQIPARAVRLLGDVRFVECKERINKVATFYRPSEVMDPAKTNALTPKYDILEGKVSEFLSAVEQIGARVKQAAIEAG